MRSLLSLAPFVFSTELASGDGATEAIERYTKPSYKWKKKYYNIRCIYPFLTNMSRNSQIYFTFNMQCWKSFSGVQFCTLPFSILLDFLFEITKSVTRSIIICWDNCKKGENKQRYLLLLILGDTLTVSGSYLVKLLWNSNTLTTCRYASRTKFNGPFL